MHDQVKSKRNDYRNFLAPEALSGQRMAGDGKTVQESDE